MTELNDICVIIPVLNEQDSIAALLSRLDLIGIQNVIVVDGGSSDATLEIVRKFEVELLFSKPGRAIQMNQGAKVAEQSILWFIHADTLPPLNAPQNILQSIAKGNELGCFRFKFDSDRLLLRFNSFMTRFNTLNFRGGDQGIFIRKSSFEKLNGYDEKYSIMEEYDLLQRANSNAMKFDLLKLNMLVSARKYDHNSYFKVNWANFIAMRAFHKGVSPENIRTRYYEMLKHPSDHR